VIPHNYRHSSAGLLAALAIACLGVWAPVTAEPQVRERHQDWTVICDKPEGAAAERCSIVQALNQRESQKQVLRIEIGYLGESTQLIGIVTVPLGVALPAGLKMRIDEGKELPYQFGQCLPNGCIVGIQVSAELLAQLKAGTKAAVTFQDGMQRPITLPVSLKGFTAAYKVIKK